MKKQSITKILLTILISMMGANVFAYDIAVENSDGITIYYNYINYGEELEVTYGSYYSGNVVIPEEITYMNKTQKVTSIGGWAFYDSGSLTSVTIPNSVTSICDCAFQNCTGLTSVTIPNSVTSIRNEAFKECRSLTSVTIPNSVTSIGNRAFWGCSGLTSVTIPNSVTSIGSETFRNCRGLTSVTIPNSVTSIGSEAFHDCRSLTSVTIPNSVTSIGNGAFYGCSSLTSLTIPNSVTSIGSLAFYNCTNILIVISLIENPFGIYGKSADGFCLFCADTFNNATLFVPVGTINKYKETWGWKDFLFIEEGTGPNGGGETPENKQCAKPTISYKDGKLTFNCETEGAVCQSTITDADIKSYSSNEVQLGVTYQISVYASKFGYQDSETVLATLCWIDVAPKTEGITNISANVRALPVMIQNNGSTLTVSGANEGTPITVYSINGTEAGSAISQNGTATIPTTLQSGSAAIVKVGDKAIKVMMK